MYLSIGPEENIDAFSMALLEDSVDCVDSTEEIGDTVLTQLRQQREQLEMVTGNLSDTNQVTSRARKLLKKIAWNACKEKLGLSLWITLFLLIDILLAYRIVTNHGHL